MAKISNVEKFCLKNNLSRAEFQYLKLRNRIGKSSIGEIKMPNGELKNIER